MDVEDEPGDDEIVDSEGIVDWTIEKVLLRTWKMWYEDKKKKELTKKNSKVLDQKSKKTENETVVPKTETKHRVDEDIELKSFWKHDEESSSLEKKIHI